jgi:hypothetical protein
MVVGTLRITAKGNDKEEENWMLRIFSLKKDK